MARTIFRQRAVRKPFLKTWGSLAIAALGVGGLAVLWLPQAPADAPVTQSEIRLFGGEEAVIHDMTGLQAPANTPANSSHTPTPTPASVNQLPLTETDNQADTPLEPAAELEHTEKAVNTVEIDNTDEVVSTEQVDAEPAELSVSAVVTEEPEAPASAEQLVDAEVPEPVWLEYKVAHGDNLTLIFKALDLPSKTLYRVLSAEGKEKPLTRLKPGLAINYQLDHLGDLLALQVEIDKMNSWLFTVNENGNYSREQLKREGEMVRGSAHGVINGPFWDSAIEAGLAAGQIDYFSNIFHWKVDFSRDLRKGDTFSVIYDEEQIDGEVTGRGQILAAMLNNKEKEYLVFRHQDGRYYDLDGNSLSNAFLRYPVDGTYPISSHFQPRRKHPITGRYQQHNGTDFLVNTGTPVLASGAGVVTRSAYNRFNGKYVAIRHNDKYESIYLHLSERLVKKGDKVTLGQRIGLSGNTGNSSGPHLHYEFHVSGKPVNPMKVKLPMAQKLPSEELARFREQAQPLLAQLAQSRDVLLAER